MRRVGGLCKSANRLSLKLTQKSHVWGHADEVVVEKFESVIKSGLADMGVHFKTGLDKHTDKEWPTTEALYCKLKIENTIGVKFVIKLTEAHYYKEDCVAPTPKCYPIAVPYAEIEITNLATGESVFVGEAIVSKPY